MPVAEETVGRQIQVFALGVADNGGRLRKRLTIRSQPLKRRMVEKSKMVQKGHSKAEVQEDPRELFKKLRLPGSRAVWIFPEQR